MYTGGLEGLQYMYAVIYRLGQIKHMGLYCCTFDNITNTQSQSVFIKKKN